MGSNFAECHPVGFRWVMKAKARGAKIMHVDPRFTRTSAMCDKHVAIRSGSDIAFLGGIVNYILANDRWFRDYVLAYTNASTIVGPDFKDSEELDGFFSGFDPAKRKYDTKSWAYDGTAVASNPQQLRPNKNADEPHAKEGQTGTDFRRTPPKTDPTLQHPHCVFQILKRHYARYTPEMVSQICGCSAEDFVTVAKTLCDNSGRDRTSAFAYAVGWTQHTVGVQYIRTAGIVQALLGNIGRPGGGILALRGHATIQGSTDIATLFNLLPGYLPAPNATTPEHQTFDGYINREMPTTGWWANGRKYVVSFLRAWYGDAATKENSWGYDFLPKNLGDHSHIPMFTAMDAGVVKGLMAIGQNPAVGGQNATFQRQAMSRLDWLVVRDIFMTETAEFWKAPDVSDPSAIKTEIFFLPAATVPEIDGSFTNTQRLLQWHEKAVDAPGDARGDLWFTHHLAKRLKKLYAGSTNPNDAPFLALTWDFGEEGPRREPKTIEFLREINGWTIADKTLLKTFADLKDDGSTASGAWIYTGVTPSPGVNRAAARKSDDYVSLGWGFAWPANRRILYNRASADPAGNPWSERKRYVWWDASVVNPPDPKTKKPVPNGKWIGYDIPDFPVTKSPTYKGVWAKGGVDAHDGSWPFIMKPDGKAWLYAPSGTVDGPLPTHYEPWEGPVKNALYGAAPRNPVTKLFNVVGNKYIDPGSPDFPIVISTYRLTEHHLSGVMSRWVPWLAELQPELFVEISPELAREKGIDNARWVTVSTPRGVIECKALVTRRLRPFQVSGRTVHQVGMPWHWGYRGIVTGGVVNSISALVGDPNVTIHEGKAFMCQVQPGRHASEVLAKLTDAATPLPHVGRRERQAAEASIEQGIQLLADAGSLDDVLQRTGLPPEVLEYLHPEAPEGVYHG
ncbi:MAG: molybdopterin-dependent oxidoreductase [Gemmatimonadota bacterium]|nr:molybdopterin-dependent oxidoreductase [Gemmatimonadota bacterium]